MPNPPRKRFQIHLSTAIVMMFVAGALTRANVIAHLLHGREIGSRYGWPVVAALLGCGPLVAACLSWLRPSQWSAAAKAVDAHYGFKDGVLSALDFVAIAAPSDFQQLAIFEATARMSGDQRRRFDQGSSMGSRPAAWPSCRRVGCW